MFDRLLSGVVELTAPRIVRVTPSEAATVPVTATVVEAPLAWGAPVQASWPESVQLHPLPVAEVKSNPPGNSAVIVMEPDEAGPRLATVKMNVIGCPVLGASYRLTASARSAISLTNKQNSDALGTLDVKIYTPKDVISVSGKIPKGTVGFMETCDKL